MISTDVSLPGSPDARGDGHSRIMIKGLELPMNDYAPSRDLAGIFNDFAVAEVDCPQTAKLISSGLYCEPGNTPPRTVRPGLPAVNDELFEWIPLCDAILPRAAASRLSKSAPAMAGGRPMLCARLAGTVL
jgi:hypothetical protein